MRDIFAGIAIAACRALRKYAIFVGQGNRQAVKFRLNGVFHCLHAQTFANALIKRQQFVIAKRVIERKHSLTVLHSIKGARRCAANALRGRT